MKKKVSKTLPPLIEVFKSDDLIRSSRINASRLARKYESMVFRDTLEIDKNFNINEEDHRLMRWLLSYYRRTGINATILGRDTTREIGLFLAFLEGDQSPLRKGKNSVAIMGHGQGSLHDRSWSVGGRNIFDYVSKLNTPTWVCSCETNYPRYFNEGRWVHPT